MARSRNKDPQALRQSLLEFATHLIITQGLHGLTMDKVVKGTGISKGGLQYHFPTRQALVDAVFDTTMQQFLAEVEAEMAADTRPGLRATRAYIRACCREMSEQEVALNQGIMAALFADPVLRERWADFINTRMPADDKGSDDGTTALFCRMAADGLCYASLCNVHPMTATQRETLVQRLLALTE
ncbi:MULTISPECIES: TetR/AcrR family transcriptional regulator [Mangrovibacter]|uniref:TetR family transcriptional regulator n=1 Tax=Mangrovibacter plantisponsor TaxID=451513 RepID=A0A317Q5A9_9ENTR|nr:MULTISPECIES: TetR/AcrR family transcriptional regulator [Mangrovibacter]PWW10813.1 TetR family transcriptional regulator [Mangrovibacter plantisponsor]